MGDVNQLTIVRRNADLVRGPVVEVGSKDYGSTLAFRALFPGMKFVGGDMSRGKGVDVVLEHCRHPFRMCENITRLLEAGGAAFISVPFAWQIHRFPSEYWRFTPEGVTILLPDLELNPARCSMSTAKPGQIEPIDDFMCRAELTVSEALARKEYGVLRSSLVRVVRRLRPFPFIFDFRYLHPPVMIHMIGQKRNR